ncbi:MAG TPA: DUF4365 domain-containing protein [Pseudoxanthomonas sp.]|nr:DUF4365 domain-containing protein [Pseudoxanthomonas sp.]
MDPNKQKEEFQYAYVCALAAHAGLNRGQFCVDDDSVDILFQGKGYTAPVRNPQIQIQLKCTSRNLTRGDVIKFPLSKKNYDDLRGEDVVVPRYLAVLTVPERTEDWLLHNHDCMALYHRCYWVSLRDAPPVFNTMQVTVDVPITQRLTTETLKQMMSAASNGEAM